MGMAKMTQRMGKCCTCFLSTPSCFLFRVIHCICIFICLFVYLSVYLSTQCVGAGYKDSGTSPEFVSACLVGGCGTSGTKMRQGGDLVQQDLSKCEQLWERAAEQGDDMARRTLPLCANTWNWLQKGSRSGTVRPKYVHKSTTILVQWPVAWFVSDYGFSGNVLGSLGS